MRSAVVLALSLLSLMPLESHAQTEEDVDKLKVKAARGDIGAERELGYSYAGGHGVTKDISEAVKWYRKAAEGGDAAAQMRLGVAYTFGKSVPQDDTEAFEWYDKAAKQGNAEAYDMLGYAYRLGKGVGSDPVQAYKWWKLAIANGSDDSKLNKLLDQLASQMSATRVAEAELLVTQWPSELVKLDREAADKGDTSAQVRLGIAYADGNGVPQDAAQAITWYLKAATAGNVRAYRLLGFAYILGTGVAEDKIKAYKWWKLAIDRGGEGGNPPLGKLFADLSAHMTAKELDAAKRLVAQWEADSEAGFSQ